MVIFRISVVKMTPKNISEKKIENLFRTFFYMFPKVAKRWSMSRKSHRKADYQSRSDARKSKISTIFLLVSLCEVL